MGAQAIHQKILRNKGTLENNNWHQDVDELEYHQLIDKWTREIITTAAITTTGFHGRIFCVAFVSFFGSSMNPTCFLQIIGSHVAIGSFGRGRNGRTDVKAKVVCGLADCAQR